MLNLIESPSLNVNPHSTLSEQRATHRRRHVRQEDTDKAMDIKEECQHRRCGPPRRDEHPVSLLLLSERIKKWLLTQSY